MACGEKGASSMRSLSRSSLVRSLLVLLVSSEAAQAIFFQGPKRAIWNLLESLGGHKKPPPSIHHYHMHYYPVPISLPKPSHHVPKIEIDVSPLHSHEPLRPYGWPSHQEPEFVLPSETSSGGWPAPPLQPEAWPDNSFQPDSSWGWHNNELLEKDHAYTEGKSGLLLQVPLHQQIVLYQPPAKDKSSLLQILFKKIRRINDAIFHPEEEEHCHEHHEDKPHVHNTLTYAAR